MKAEPVCNVRIQMSKDQAESLADDLQRLFEDPDFDIDPKDMPRLHDLYNLLGNEGAIDELFM